MQLLAQSAPTHTDPIEREVDLLLTEQGFDIEYAKSQRKEALVLHLITQKAIKEETLTTLKNMPDDFYHNLRNTQGKRDLCKRIESSIRQEMAPTQPELAAKINWVKSPYNAHKKNEVVAEIWTALKSRCVPENVLEKLVYQCGSTELGWHDREYTTTFYIYKGAPYLFTGSFVYTFTDYHYPPVVWDQDILDLYEENTNKLYRCEHELSSTDITTSPSFGVCGHEVLIERLCELGYGFFEAQKLSILAGFIVDLDGAEALRKRFEFIYTALDELKIFLPRHFEDQSAVAVA